MKKALSFAVLALGLAQTEALGLVQAEEPKTNPIKKVVSLLQEMKKQIEKEGKEDAEAYDKYSCWCKSNEKEKTKAIADATARVKEIEAMLASSTAQIEQLKIDMVGLEKETKANQNALAAAAQVRANEIQAYQKDEAEVKKTRDMLTKAIKTLSKAGFVQAKETHHEVATMLMQVKSVVEKRADSSFESLRFNGLMQKDLYSMLASFEDGHEDLNLALAQEAQLPGEPPKVVRKKAGPSKEVLGMVTAMNDQFTRDLVNGQKRDFEAEVGFQKVRAAKNTEIAAAADLIKRKKGELAAILEKRATADGEIRALKFAIQADTTFLVNLKKDCKAEDRSFANRTKARNDEVVAVGDAVNVLTEDSARELLGKTVSFMQVGDVSDFSVHAKERAYHRLAATATRNGNWALMQTGVSVRLDAMDKVKAVLAKSLRDLKTQQKEEAKRKEQCLKDIRGTEGTQKDARRTGSKLDATQETVTFNMGEAIKELKKLKGDLAASEVAVTKAGTERQEQNKIFREAILDAKATVKVLNKAVARLKKFYAFMETGQQPAAAAEPKKDTPAPPKGKAVEKQSSKAAGVFQLLTKIAQDAEKSELKLTYSEQKAEERYELLMKDAAKSIKATRNAIDEKKTQILKHKSKSAETAGSQTANKVDRKQIRSLLQAQHNSCDFLIKYFEDRRQARRDEMDAITDATAILSGAK